MIKTPQYIYIYIIVVQFPYAPCTPFYAPGRAGCAAETPMCCCFFCMVCKAQQIEVWPEVYGNINYKALEASKVPKSWNANPINGVSIP